MLLQALQYQKAERGTAGTKSIALGADVFLWSVKEGGAPHHLQLPGMKTVWLSPAVWDLSLQ